MSLNETGLKSLKNMPSMPKLERLELSSNQLSGPSVAKTIASLYPELVTLKMAKNHIADVSHVTDLKSLTKLESLDMSENPFCAKVATDKNEYQEKMRKILQIEALYLLDGHDKDGESLESEGSEEEEDDAELGDS